MVRKEANWKKEYHKLTRYLDEVNLTLTLHPDTRADHVKLEVEVDTSAAHRENYSQILSEDIDDVAELKGFPNTDHPNTICDQASTTFINSKPAECDIKTINSEWDGPTSETVVKQSLKDSSSAVVYLEKSPQFSLHPTRRVQGFSSFQSTHNILASYCEAGTQTSAAGDQMESLIAAEKSQGHLTETPVEYVVLTFDDTKSAQLASEPEVKENDIEVNKYCTRFIFHNFFINMQVEDLQQQLLEAQTHGNKLQLMLEDLEQKFNDQIQSFEFEAVEKESTIVDLQTKVSIKLATIFWLSVYIPSYFLATVFYKQK